MDDSSPSIGSDGTISIGSQNGHIYAVNPNGTLKWSYQAGDSIDSSPAIGQEGTLFVGSLDTNLYALSPGGSLLWKFETDGLIISSPPFMADTLVRIFITPSVRETAKIIHGKPISSMDEHQATGKNDESNLPCVSVVYVLEKFV